MTRAVIRFVMCGALVCLSAAVTSAQTQTTSETKKFTVISVDGSQLVVRLPEGTRELTVPPDFRFTVDGKSLAVSELKPGMSGTATITTKTTTTPVTVTEVKNGTVTRAMGTSIIVATDGTFKMFSQSDVDKRGVKIMREGKPAEISDFRENDRITATIITPKPPRVMTEKEVNADAGPERGRRRGSRAAKPAAAPAAAAPAPATAARRGACGCGTDEENPAEDREPVADARGHWARLAPRGARPHLRRRATR